MTAISKLINAFLPILQSQRERNEAYLGEAVDIQDLERRMRELDLRNRASPQALPLSLGLR